jgi:hypothetical protein
MTKMIGWRCNNFCLTLFLWIAVTLSGTEGVAGYTTLNITAPFEQVSVVNIDQFQIHVPFQLKLSVKTDTGGGNSSGLLLFGRKTNSSTCENGAYVSIGPTGTFHFGVKKCDGGDQSSSPIESKTTIQGGTLYNIICIYNGTFASLHVNGNLEASERKYFNFSSSVNKLVVGAGAFSIDSDIFSFGIISNILVESFTNFTHQVFMYVEKTNNNCLPIRQYGNVFVNKACFLPNEVLVNNGTLNITGIPDADSDYVEIIYLRTHAIIYGNETTRLFKVENGGSLILKKLILASGVATNGGGGGIHVAGPKAFLTADTVIFGGCYSNDFGGSLYVRNATEVKLSNVVIADSIGGGIYIHGESDSNPTLLISENIVYFNNEAKDARHNDLFCKEHCIYRTIFSDSCTQPTPFVSPHTDKDDSQSNDIQSLYCCKEGPDGTAYTFYYGCTDCSTDSFNGDDYSPWNDIKAEEFCLSWISNQNKQSSDVFSINYCGYKDDPCAGRSDGYFAEVGTVLDIYWKDSSTVEQACKVDTSCSENVNQSICQVAFDYRDNHTYCELPNVDDIDDLKVATNPNITCA